MEMIKKFIKDNHELVEEYYDCYFNRYKEQDWKEQLRILFINVLNAGRDGKISEKAESVIEFEKHIRQMKSHTYEDLLKAFNAKNYQELFERFKGFKQMGDKKSALFLRDILFFNNIIQNIPLSVIKEYLVPVDRVIVRTVNSIFNENFVSSKKETFDEINIIAKKTFPEKPILFEDLWFWGRFYRCKENKKSKIPYCRFNKDLLTMDINVTMEYRDKMLRFSEKQPDCPFKGICSRK